MINLGFSTDSLTRASKIANNALKYVNLSEIEQTTLDRTYSGINMYTSNPKKSTKLLFMGGQLPSNLSGYEGIINFLQSIADAKQNAKLTGVSNNTSSAPLTWGNPSTPNTSIFAGTELPILKDTSSIQTSTEPTVLDPSTPPAQPEPSGYTVPAEPDSPVPVHQSVTPAPTPTPQPTKFSGAGGDGITTYYGVQAIDGKRQDIEWKDAGGQVLYSSVRTKNDDNTWTDVKKDQAGNVTTSKYDANFNPI